MRSMGHPDYVYQPWSEERRRAASVRMKRIILLKKKARLEAEMAKVESALQSLK